MANNKYLHYFEKDLGSVFVFVFMVWLVSCMVPLIFKQDKIAEFLASFAYLFLVIGGFIKFIQMLREMKENS